MKQVAIQLSDYEIDVITYAVMEFADRTQERGIDMRSEPVQQEAKTIRLINDKLRAAYKLAPEAP